MYRQRGQASARLAITGRDVRERTLALQMDWSSGCWQSLGEAGDFELTERQQEILDALKELVRAIGQDKGNTHRRPQDMVSAGLIQREGEYYTAS